ncbi:RDD family protein [Dyella sp. M7H15-1]|uniref:RDD family protein n=1 Tax=Dyella sp. M7H15-1 TaxID=2501295 RepID=UPI0010050BD6|nr:RDD family protein [Dyella sp. M7H15-1]QAU23738.1 RDD family protein [Dyella sp. M7H15-1]
MTATTMNVICPLWRRWIALVYDLVAVLAIVMVVGLICQLATGGRLITAGAQVHIAWWYQPLQGIVVATYFVLSWLRGGQTLGMRSWRIRVTAGDGDPLSLRQAMIRVLVASLPLLLLLLAPAFGLNVALWTLAAGWIVWLLAAQFVPRRRTVYDLAAGTEIRRIG